jgi:hypothetical protein
MKNLKVIQETTIKRPSKAKISEKEAIKRMKDFDERREKFLAVARKSKNGSLSS